MMSRIAGGLITLACFFAVYASLSLGWPIPAWIRVICVLEVCVAFSLAMFPRNPGDSEASEDRDLASILRVRVLGCAGAFFAAALCVHGNLILEGLPPLLVVGCWLLALLGPILLLWSRRNSVEGTGSPGGDSRRSSGVL